MHLVWIKHSGHGKTTFQSFLGQSRSAEVEYSIPCFDAEPSVMVMLKGCEGCVEPIAPPSPTQVQLQCQAVGGPSKRLVQLAAKEKLGLDQSKFDVLTRELLDPPRCRESRETLATASYGPDSKRQKQMPQSDASADFHIFMDDAEENVKRKIKKAICPEKQVKDNLLVSMIRRLVFPMDGQFEVQRDAENGGNCIFYSPDEFEKAYSDGDVHPADLKHGLASAVNRMLAPVRHHFTTDLKAARLVEMVRRNRVAR